jgi:hypothetical protein
VGIALVDDLSDFDAGQVCESDIDPTSYTTCTETYHHSWEIVSCLSCTDGDACSAVENCHINNRELFQIDPRNGQLTTTPASSGREGFQA